MREALRLGQHLDTALGLGEAGDVRHLGKLAFRWIYWNLLIKGRPIPLIPTAMSMAGKRLEGGAQRPPTKVAAKVAPVAAPVASAQRSAKPVTPRPAASPARSQARPTAAPGPRPARTEASASAAPAVRTQYPADPRQGVDSKADPATVLDAPIIPKF